MRANPNLWFKLKPLFYIVYFYMVDWFDQLSDISQVSNF